ncbi:hypothetical protein CROQUDRAFT_649659, partial [Cronartium quercuum f. sp. fusiforme G11]
MTEGFLEQLTQRARAEHGLAPLTGDDRDLTLAPIHIPSDADEQDPVGYEAERSEDDVQMLEPGGHSSDNQPAQLDPTDPTALEGGPPDDQPEGPDEQDDEDDDGTTDSDEESRPKKKDLMPTIRLTLDLLFEPTPLSEPIPITCERSVTLLAKEAGYVLPADTAITYGASVFPEPGLLPEPSYNNDGGPPPKRRRRRKPQERDEGYDRDDPFVDDSEALITEPKFYHAPARDGFFVAEGPLELKADPKKRGRKPSSKVTKRVPSNMIPNIALANAIGPSNQIHVPPSNVVNHHGRSEVPPGAGSSKLSTPLETRPSQPEAVNSIVGPATSTSEHHSDPTKSAQPIDTSIIPVQSTSSIKCPTFPYLNMDRPALSPRNEIANGRRASSGTGLRENPINLDDEDDDTPAKTRSSPSPQSPHYSNTERHLSQGKGRTSEIPDLGQSRPGRPMQPDTPPKSSTPGRSDFAVQVNSMLLSTNSDKPVSSAFASDLHIQTVSSSRPARLSFLRTRPGPPRKKEDPIAPELQDAIRQLKIEVDAALPFAPKQFPPKLIAPTLEVAQLALDLCEYDAPFFHQLAEIFPYNTFTIRKLVTREIHPQRKKYYDEQINQRMDRLKPLINQAMVPALSEYQRQVDEFDVAVKKWEDAEAARQSGQRSGSSKLPTNAATILDATSSQPSLDVGMQYTMDLTGDDNEPRPKPPTKNTFKFNLAMRELYYEILKLEDERCDTIQNYQALIDKTVTMKDISNRKQLYQKLVKLWPDDFMTTSRLSRE